MFHAAVREGFELPCSQFTHASDDAHANAKGALSESIQAYIRLGGTVRSVERAEQKDSSAASSLLHPQEWTHPADAEILCFDKMIDSFGQRLRCQVLSSRGKYQYLPRV